MPLEKGTRVGPYEVTGLLGVGGMGEVYRARDSRLARDVALKVLPEIYAADAERLGRFQREAQVLAALKHPNIGDIYGLEETSITDVGAGFLGSPKLGTSGGGSRPIRALVLELVEGETLADRIARGPIPIDEALPIAKLIGEALQAAHEQGVIHRDLKPSNIKVQSDGSVKVLDFGLAKLTDAGGAAGASEAGGAGIAHLSMSPTITSPAATGLGVILGTAAYMAPEQAKGQPADKRSDVWAFGCLLFEMLAGKRAFEADDISDTLALVLKGEPDWSALPSALPASIRTLIHSCLERDRRQRLADISGALFVLAHQSDLAPTVSGHPALGSRRTLVWRRVAIAAAVVLAPVGTGVGAWLATRPATPTATRFFVTSPDGNAFVTGARSGTSAVISPDGRTLAFTARDSSGKILIWLRPIGALTAQPLAGTDGAQFPFWSPDSRFIGYFTQDKLMKIAAIGGPPQTLGMVNLGRGGTWSKEGQIVYGSNTGPLYRVSSAGGPSSAVTRLASGFQDHRFPSFLPDGRHVLFFGTAIEGLLGVFVASLDTGETKRLIDADTGALYDATHGYVLFGRRGALMAQSFNPTKLLLRDEPFPIAEHLESGVYAGIVTFSISDGGALVYGVGGANDSGARLTWVDRRGNSTGTVGPIANYRGPALALDEKRVAVKRREVQAALDYSDIWITDVTRDATSRFTFNPAEINSSPVWSRDGTRIAFAALRGVKWGLYAKASNGGGTEERLIESQEGAVIATSWSPDGRYLVYSRVGEKTATDIWLLPLFGDRKPIPLVMTPFNENHGEVSPDGRWLAYDSNESGQIQTYVRSFPSGESRWQISSGGGRTGSYPRWRGDGRELFYMDGAGAGKLMAVEIRVNGSALEAGTPTALFDSSFANLGGERIPSHAYAVSADGQRFLIPRAAASAAQAPVAPIAVVLNWTADIQH